MKAKLCAVSEIPRVGVKKIDFFGREILVFRVKDQARAVLNYCLHLGGPLELKDGELVCGWHGARFDCEQGACKSGPSQNGAKLMFLPTSIEDEQLIYVYGE